MRESKLSVLGISVVVGVLAGSSGCQGDLEDVAPDWEITEQAIYYGTRSPSITNLSAGEEEAIGWLADSTGELLCTATLIDRDVAVTAQHCVVNTIAVDDMRFGMGDPSNPDAVVEVHSAPFHDTLDVALLLLLTDAVTQVPTAEPLPFLREAPEQSWIGTDVEAAGFGSTHDNSTGLYYVTVELTGIQDDFFEVDGHGQQGICFGDSGGPLFVNVETGDPVIIGVESHGDASCVDTDYETRLDQAMAWMDAEMAAFDPNSPRQTGVQTDGGVGEDFGGMFCATSPTGSMSHVWFVVFMVAFALRLAARRRMVMVRPDESVTRRRPNRRR